MTNLRRVSPFICMNFDTKHIQSSIFVVQVQDDFEHKEALFVFKTFLYLSAIQDGETQRGH